MKKLILATVAGSLVAAPAFAKTEGTSVGLSLINTEVRTYDINSSEYEDSNVSYGIDFKHAISFGNLYVAPGLFYDHNATDGNQAVSGSVTNENFRYSYGIKADIGYDVNDKFAVFATLGHSQTRGSSTVDGVKTDSTREGFIYGAGVKMALSDRLDAGLSYEVTDFGKSDDLLDDSDNFQNTYNVIRLRLGYKF